MIGGAVVAGCRCWLSVEVLLEKPLSEIIGGINRRFRGGLSGERTGAVRLGYISATGWAEKVAAVALLARKPQKVYL